MTDWIKKINWNNEGLLPVIIQEFESKDVLMFAWMNEKTLRASLKNKTTVVKIKTTGVDEGRGVWTLPKN